MSTANLTPYVVVYDADLKTSTIGNRIFEPLIKVRGRWPRCDYQSAVACSPDAPKLYGLPNRRFCIIATMVLAATRLCGNGSRICSPRVRRSAKRSRDATGLRRLRGRHRYRDNPVWIS